MSGTPRDKKTRHQHAARKQASEHRTSGHRDSDIRDRRSSDRESSHRASHVSAPKSRVLQETSGNVGATKQTNRKGSDIAKVAAGIDVTKRQAPIRIKFRVEKDPNASLDEIMKERIVWANTVMEGKSALHRSHMSTSQAPQEEAAGDDFGIGELSLGPLPITIGIVATFFQASAYITFGTPEQQSSRCKVVFDTGSSVLWINERTYSQRLMQGGAPRGTDTNMKINVKYSGQNQFRGKLTKQAVTVGNAIIPEQTFAVVDDRPYPDLREWRQRHNISGILGFGKSNATRGRIVNYPNGRVISVLDKLLQQSGGEEVVGMDIPMPEEYSASGAPATAEGEVHVGWYNDNYTYDWVTAHSGNAIYTLDMHFGLGGTRFTNGHRAIMDTGSPFIHVPNAVMESYKNLMNQEGQILHKHSSINLYYISFEDYQNLKDIEIMFNGASVPLPAYMQVMPGGVVKQYLPAADANRLYIVVRPESNLNIVLLGMCWISRYYLVRHKPTGSIGIATVPSKTNFVWNSNVGDRGSSDRASSRQASLASTPKRHALQDKSVNVGQKEANQTDRRGSTTVKATAAIDVTKKQAPKSAIRIKFKVERDPDADLDEIMKERIAWANAVVGGKSALHRSHMSTSQAPQEETAGDDLGMGELNLGPPPITIGIVATFFQASAYITFGTPEKSASCKMVFDTGSSVLWINERTYSQRLMQGGATRGTDTNLRINVKYSGQNQFRGKLTKQAVTVGNTTIPEQTFAVVDDAQYPFLREWRERHKIIGILGFGKSDATRGQIANHPGGRVVSVLDRLLQQSGNEEVIGMNIPIPEEYSASGAPATAEGEIHLGWYKDNYTYDWVTAHSGNAIYTLDMHFGLGGTRFTNGHRAIMDTGSPFIHVPGAVMESYKTLMNREGQILHRHSSINLYYISSNDYQNLKDIEVMFNGASVPLPRHMQVMPGGVVKQYLPAADANRLYIVIRPESNLSIILLGMCWISRYYLVSNRSTDPNSIGIARVPSKTDFTWSGLS
ncbi:acid protease [Fomitiporia mediterranea MF3/22]|uniref:acid protease n=1 Tax=Fomitiporia mediterranea (strain MF3/22) TaxID=694068 RepID=UPI00044076EF|nr:acid protease [Fomitiporia mediterranea MF3/22]EJD02458.1 acid protease [Fomitiporia mediterranea MF3/22]